MIEIHLFGPTRVAFEGRQLAAGDLGGSKPRHILEMLALDLGLPVSKDVLAERLWEGSPPRSYIPTLESYVCGLRRRLKAFTGELGMLATTSGGYQLDQTRVRVDVVEVNRLLDSGDVSSVQETLTAKDGDLLASAPYAAWAEKARGDLASRSAGAYVQAAHRANELGDNALAASLARAASTDPYWCEPAVRELMHALAASGNRTQALIEYQQLRTNLRDELGIEPSPSTRQLYMSILQAGSPETTDDVSVLLGLLRFALESEGCAHRSNDPAMAEVARLLLARV